MSLVDQQINHARRRLTFNILLERLSLAVLVAAGLWAVGIIVVRLVALDLPLWHGSWVAAGLAAIGTVIATSLARPSLLHAAVALDAAAGLKERLSTALAVRTDADPFARAAVGDAEKAAGRLHVPAHIRQRPPTLWPWSLATMLAAVLLCWLMPAVGLFAGERDEQDLVSRTDVEAEHSVIKTELDERLNKIKELAQDNPDLKDIANDIQPLAMPDTPGVTPEDIRREAVKRIDAVGDRLRQEMKEAGNNPLKDVKRLLQKLEPQGGDDNTAKLSQSLSSGDFEGAKQALQKMTEQIKEAAGNAQDPAAKQKLEQMQEQLARLSEQVAKLSDTVQLQKELENKAGLSEEEAKKLMEQLSKMDPKQVQKELQKQLADKCDQKQIEQIAKKIQQNKQARQACQKLAESLSKAAQACQQCNSPGGADSGSSQGANALSDAAGQLSELEMSEMMMDELEAQLSDLDNLRNDICDGKYECNRRGDQPCGVGGQGPRSGLGLGERVGREKTAYKRDPTKAKTRFQGGTVIGQMLVDGPQVRGQASAEVLNATESEVRDALDAIEREEVPRQYRKVLQEYFERLAGLVREQKQSSGDPADAGPDAPSEGAAGPEGAGEEPAAPADQS